MARQPPVRTTGSLLDGLMGNGGRVEADAEDTQHEIDEFFDKHKAPEELPA